MSLVGAHIKSDIDDIMDQAKIIKEHNGNIIQIFVNISSKKSRDIYKQLSTFLVENKMKCVVHASYTINCAQNWTYHSWWIRQFIMEIEYASMIGAIGIVVHLGKQMDLSNEAALNNMYMSFLYCHSQTKSSNVKILIETSTGQGTEMCFELDNLAHFYKKFSKHTNKNIANRFGLCLDTCHIFAAGYDIRGEDNIKSYIKYFDEQIGLEHIKLIHLNDSYKDLASKVDRHSNLGEGFIGKDSLIMMANLFKKLNVPLILETPSTGILKDLEKIT
jgi:deoxyribonuclease-4